jgi:hypothetical protein
MIRVLSFGLQLLCGRFRLERYLARFGRHASTNGVGLHVQRWILTESRLSVLNFSNFANVKFNENPNQRIWTEIQGDRHGEASRCVH